MLANFTEETCTGTTGNVTLTGATQNRIPFNQSFSDGQTIAYVIEGADAIKKCAGTGVFNNANNSISRNDNWTYDGTVNQQPTSNLDLGSGTHIVRVDVTQRLLETSIKNQITISSSQILDDSAFSISFICTGTTSDYTITLPAAENNAGRTVTFLMSPDLTKFVTIAGKNSNQINGKATRIMWANESATLVSNGSNWNKLSGNTIALVGALTSDSDQSVQSHAIVKKDLHANQVFTTNNVSLIDTVNSQVLIKRSSNYNIFCSSRIKNISGSVPIENFIYIDGNDSGIISRYATGGDWPTLQLISNFKLQEGSFLELYVRQYTGSNQNYVNNIMQELIATEIPQW